MQGIENKRTIKLQVLGMTCIRCVKKVQKTLEGIDGVSLASVAPVDAAELSLAPPMRLTGCKAACVRLKLDDSWLPLSADPIAPVAFAKTLVVVANAGAGGV